MLKSKSASLTASALLRFAGDGRRAERECFKNIIPSDRHNSFQNFTNKRLVLQNDHHYILLVSTKIDTTSYPTRSSPNRMEVSISIKRVIDRCNGDVSRAVVDVESM